MALMNGKVVVITGATSGIGLVAAGKLAGMGARLVLIARDRGRGEGTLAKLRSAGPAFGTLRRLVDDCGNEASGRGNRGG
jgi:NAD(P)-dependent dehydrogenase (short-subunit alcohol dehydrogenase family)